MRKTSLERFFDKVYINIDECWLWTAHINACGYGCFNIGGKSKLAHRVSYAWQYGEFPNYPKWELDHLCRHRDCVNPEHLEIINHLGNIRRGDLSGNGNTNRVKTHCPQGHEYSGENLFIDGHSRKCRECVRRNAKDGYNRRKNKDTRG